MLKIKILSAALILVSTLPGFAQQIPGQVYGYCYMQKNAAKQSIYGEKVVWPFRTCPTSGSALPQCASGFTLVQRNFSEGNTDVANYNHANKIYWVSYGCIKN